MLINQRTFVFESLNLSKLEAKYDWSLISNYSFVGELIASANNYCSFFLMISSVYILDCMALFVELIWTRSASMLALNFSSPIALRVNDFEEASSLM